MSQQQPPRRAVDTAAMRAAVAGFVESCKPHLHRTDAQGVTARMLIAVLPVFCEALAAEMDANSNPLDAYLAVVAVMSNIAGSSAKTFRVNGEGDARRAQVLLADVLGETVRRLSGAGTFARVAYEPAGRA